MARGCAAWVDELEALPERFPDKLDRRARRHSAPWYLRGLPPPSERKSVRPWCARLALLGSGSVAGAVGATAISRELAARMPPLEPLWRQARCRGVDHCRAAELPLTGPSREWRVFRSGKAPASRFS